MKKTFIKICLLWIMFISIYSQCEFASDPEYRMDLVNNSDHLIGYYFATGGEYGTMYPDSLPETNRNIRYNINEIKNPGCVSHLNWDKFFEALPCDTLSVFIFHTDTLNKYTWEEVRDGYKILRRYDLSLEDIDEMDYTIIYP